MNANFRLNILHIVLVSVLLLAMTGGPSQAQEPPPPQPGGQPAAPQSTATNINADATFTYQGQLKVGENTYTGSCDFTFAFYDSETGGALVHSDIRSNVPVTNSLFTTQLDYEFQGAQRWIEIGVSCPHNASPSYTTLSPRQRVTGAPYAISLMPDAQVTFYDTADTPLSAAKLASSSFAGLAGYGYYTNTLGVYGSASVHQGIGVKGEGPTGVLGVGGGIGVKGEGSTGVLGTGGTIGVKGESTVGTGVSGDASVGSGVRGSSAFGAGVTGVAFIGPGVYGESLGRGVWGKATLSSGYGVYAENTAEGGAGLFAQGGQGGYAAVFSGTVQTHVLEITGGSDLSEQFDITTSNEHILPGFVVCIDADYPGKLTVCHNAYDRTVAGIVSGAGGIETGMMMGQQGSKADGAYPVALTGRVYVWADASSGTISPGDLMTTSGVPGHAMKVTDHAKSMGAIIGKAMTHLTEGRGLVLLLVSLQ